MVRRHSLISGSHGCVLISVLIIGTFGADAALSHNADFPVAGKQLVLKTDKKPNRHRFMYKSEKDFVNIVPLHDPSVGGAALLVRGVGPDAGHSGLIQLDPTLWKPLGKPAGSDGYKYVDKKGTHSSVRKVVLRNGKLQVLARGEDWPWEPAGPQNEVWVHVRVEDEWYCSRFGGEMKKNEADFVKAKNALSPGACPDQVCGNGIVELGEDCDDGNLDEEDGCTRTCEIGTCVGTEFATTFEGIQASIFDNASYGCASALCHGIAEQGGLNLTEGVSFANLVGVASTASLKNRVEPGDDALSFLYEKLAAKTLGTPLSAGSPMPSNANTVSEDHLEALRVWTNGGAPENTVVAGAADLLGGCSPDPQPLIIPPPAHPGEGVGAQFWSNPWPLPSQTENEVCYATYYDLTQTDLVPDSALVDCPTVCKNNPLLTCSVDEDCGGSTCISVGINNPSDQCFRYHAQHLYQDPQSHHAFIRIYLGGVDTTDTNWGDWTYRFAELDPSEGQDCDPLAVDPSLGYNPGCRSEVQEAVACLGAGPPDLSSGSIEGLTGSATTPTFTGSGTPVFQQEFADGVYSILPMQGILVWNSHAFNLTNFDTTMSLYLNLFFAEPTDQLYRAVPIFDDDKIFVQNVPPFETREYCDTETLPVGSNVFLLTSHMHSHGVRWRTWNPPNIPCTGACSPRVDPPDYLSTDYADPVNQYHEPPMQLGPSASERTFLFCALYDNGATPTSPPVKRQSTSPEPPLIFGLPVGPGGPCADTQTQCMAGPNRGLLCNADDALCDSFPGAGDGECDACPVRGGVTTGDEMFILQGAYFIVDP